MPEFQKIVMLAMKRWIGFLQPLIIQVQPDSNYPEGIRDGNALIVMLEQQPELVRIAIAAIRQIMMQHQTILHLHFHTIA